MGVSAGTPVRAALSRWRSLWEGVSERPLVQAGASVGSYGWGSQSRGPYGWGVPMVGEMFLFMSPCTRKLGLLVCLQKYTYLHICFYVCYCCVCTPGGV